MTALGRIRLGVVALGALLVAAACAPAPAPTTPVSVAPRHRVVILGDSLTSAPWDLPDRVRWHDLVADGLSGPAGPWVGARLQQTDGVGGWTPSERNTAEGRGPQVEYWDGAWGYFTTWSYAGKPWMFPPVASPDLLVIALGSNDIGVGYSPQLWADGLRFLLDHFDDRACLVVFPWWPTIYPEVTAWADAARAVATERSCDWVDLRAEVGPPVEGVTSRDVNHPNRLGQQRWASVLGPHVAAGLGRPGEYAPAP
ncbi:MAG: SGNH/GDSL hydrolase family protein [Microthrixaceae bacterium]